MDLLIFPWYKPFFFFFFYVGELKETKAYQKWAKKVSQMKPPTSPLRRKGKWVLYWVFSVHFKDIYLSRLWCKNICLFFCHITDQLNSQNQIYLQLYLSAEMRGKTSLIPCFHQWCPNMGVMQILNPLKKNLKLHRGKLKAERPPTNQSGSDIRSYLDFILGLFL